MASEEPPPPPPPRARITSAGDALSRITLVVPLPLEVVDMKIQPAPARVKRSEVPGAGDETTSSSETRLFCFLSPANRTVIASAPAKPLTNSGDRTEAINVILMPSGLF